MKLVQIGSADPKYLSATDILIGDMSDTNYEFLLFDRPIIQLANEWLRENFPDIGIKTDLEGLEDAIYRSIEYPDEFREQREYWLAKTIHQPDGHSARRVLDTITQHSGIAVPKFVFIHGDNSVRKTNLDPLMREAMQAKINADCVTRVDHTQDPTDTIFVAAHFADLDIPGGYKVHLDHGLKGQGTANVEMSFRDYQNNDFFPHINLHITAGEVGQERTQWLIGPHSDRAVIGGYPKADDLLCLNTESNKQQVYAELRLERDGLLITYAPAGRESYEKPGGSYRLDVIHKLKEIAARSEHNFLVKLKSPQPALMQRVRRRFGRELRKILPARMGRRIGK
jgi:hypothetical protein